VGQPRRPLIDGFTPEQRFFLGWAQGWRGKYRDEYARLLVNVDPHSPPRWRVNGPLSNMTEFRKAFACNAGDAMVRPDSVQPHIWSRGAMNRIKGKLILVTGASSGIGGACARRSRGAG